MTTLQDEYGEWIMALFERAAMAREVSLTAIHMMHQEQYVLVHELRRK